MIAKKYKWNSFYQGSIRSKSKQMLNFFAKQKLLSLCGCERRTMVLLHLLFIALICALVFVVVVR